MDADRWKQIEKLFQSALEHTPAERASFLATEYDGDEATGDE